MKKEKKKQLRTHSPYLRHCSNWNYKTKFKRKRL